MLCLATNSPKFGHFSHNLPLVCQTKHSSYLQLDQNNFRSHLEQSRHQSLQNMATFAQNKGQLLNHLQKLAWGFFIYEGAEL